jgi:hypothetical protein
MNDVTEVEPKHAPNFVDITGQRFGRLVVVKWNGRDKHRGLTWLCRCVCGNEAVVAGRSLRSGSTKSCGCLNKEKRDELHKNNLIDLTGKRFGRLVVIKRSESKKKKTYWECKCDCGKITVTRADGLVGGTTRSCGCLSIEILKGFAVKHGFSNHPVYTLFENMKKRCYRKSCREYKNYGGRGIAICDEWLEDRTVFFSWAFANGWELGLDIDRKDNDSGYSPENCTFTTRAINSAHRRNTRHYILYGKYFASIAAAAKEFNVSQPTIDYWCGLQNKKYPAREGCFSFQPYGGKDANK